MVDDVSFTFEAGRLYVIVGPSGAGKSSLLRLLNRMDEPTGGEILFNGEDYHAVEPWELRRKVGFLFQTPHLFEGTVRDNIRYANREITDERIYGCLERVQLRRDMLDAPTDNLSIGEKQRVALARLLATDPLVALLDEPTSALDPANTEAIERLIKHVADEHGITIIMVSHSPDQVVRLKGEALLMSAGRLIEHGPAEELIGNPRSMEGRKYVNGELS